MLPVWSANSNPVKRCLTALGDPTRQHLICIMLQQKCSGERVIELARKTNLSRPAISPPYANPEREWASSKAGRKRPASTTIWTLRWGELDNLLSLFGDIREFMKNVPDRSGED